MAMNVEMKKLRARNVELQSHVDHFVRQSQELHAALGGALQRAHHAEDELRALQREFNTMFDELQHLRRQEMARQISGAIETE